MLALQSFLLAFSVSYLGSIPPGVLNLTVIDISIRRTLQHAFYFSLAAALVEFVQGFIALQFSNYLSSHPSIEYGIQLFVIPVFLGLGIYYLLKKDPPPSDIHTDESNAFMKGVLLSVVNPLAIPFWLVWATYFNQKGFQILDNGVNMYAFIVGISLGSLATLMTFSFLSQLILSKIQSLNRWINEIIGGILIILGIFQLISVL